MNLIRFIEILVFTGLSIGGSNALWAEPALNCRVIEGGSGIEIHGSNNSQSQYACTAFCVYESNVGSANFVCEFFAPAQAENKVMCGANFQNQSIRFTNTFMRGLICKQF